MAGFREAGVGGAEGEAPGARGVAEELECVAAGEAFGEFVGVVEAREERAERFAEIDLDVVHIG